MNRSVAVSVKTRSLRKDEEAMADSVMKSEPAGTPPEQVTFGKRFRDAMKEPDRFDVGVAMRVSGGLEGERYDFEFEASSRGLVKCGMSCQISHRKADGHEMMIDPAEFARLLKRIDYGAIVAAVERQGGFPPDSLIGCLEVRIDQDRSVVYFLADPEQANTVGLPLPPAIARGAGVIYEFAELLLDEPNLRP